MSVKCRTYIYVCILYEKNDAVELNIVQLEDNDVHEHDNSRFNEREKEKQILFHSCSFFFSFSMSTS